MPYYGTSLSTIMVPENCWNVLLVRYSLLNNQGFEMPMDARSRGPGGRGGATPSGSGFRPNRDYHGSISGPAGRPVGPRPSLERNVEGVSRYDEVLVLWC